MHVGLPTSGVADRADRRALGDDRTSRDRQRAEMDERDRKVIGRADADGETAAGNRAGKAHRSTGRREHGRAQAARNGDSAVLPSGVWVRTVECELAEHRPLGGPCPRLSAGDDHEQ
jgi:hypothetical protein